MAREIKPRPAHYKVVCISLYTADLERLDALVRDLRARRGTGKANRSSVLREALEAFAESEARRG